MFAIRRGQLEELDRLARADFHRRLAAYLRAELPDETAASDDAGLLQFIQECDRRAVAHGIETESGIAQWACLRLVIGPAFYDHPLFRDYFEAPGPEPETRLEMLADAINDMDPIEDEPSPRAGGRPTPATG